MKNFQFHLFFLAALVSFMAGGCKPHAEGTSDGAGASAPAMNAPVESASAKTTVCAKKFAAELAQCYVTQNKAMEEYLNCYNPLREEEKKLNNKCEAICNTALKTNDKAAWQKCTECQITITPSLTELHSKMQECTDSIMARSSRGLLCSQEVSSSYSSCLAE